MGLKRFSIIPILIGKLEKSDVNLYGDTLAPYLTDPRGGSLFVISSDFCHYGERFSFTKFDKSEGEIWQQVQSLDEAAMKIIMDKDIQKFQQYLAVFFSLFVLYSVDEFSYTFVRYGIY